MTTERDALPGERALTRRRFFRAAVRAAIAGGIGLVAAIAARRPRAGAVSCAAPGTCRSCASVGSCVLPQGLSARRVMEKR